MVEFTLVAPVMLMFIFGIIEFGRYEVATSGVDQAASAGIRFAVTHPSAYSNAATASSGSIQAAIQTADTTTSIVNDDTHISIKYFDASGSSATECGYYDATANGGAGGFVAETGYTQGSNCAVPGNIVQVSVTANYVPVTPIVSTLLPSSFTITSTRQLIEEQ